MKSRDSKRGVFAPVTAVWRWLWAPRKNPHAVEERADQRRRDKRRRGTSNPARMPSNRKPEAAKVEVFVKYVGFDIPKDFVIGYGLDFDEKYRNLPFIAVLAKHMYS